MRKVKHYEIYGPLFWSTTAFAEKFDVIDDPEEVIVDFRESKISDMSAIDAVHKLTERYAKAGKKLHLRYLVLTVVSCCMLRTMLLILISLRTLLTKWCQKKKQT
jgi:MFS superfamily sulfate permease-like transporter